MPRRLPHCVFAICLTLLMSTSSARAQTAARPVSAPVTSHPRLWVTQADLPRLRAWAVASNPMYQEGLLALATRAKQYMDENRVPGQDNGGNAYSPYYTEGYAHLFAFLSLVDPDPANRADYAQRARTLLMYVINLADQGAADDQPFRDPNFAVSDRSRWIGVAFPLTVDWIYDSLTASDKSAIRRVFLRWIDENEDSYPNPYYFNHDLPRDPFPVNDPLLLDLDDDHHSALRYAMNNYFMGHARNTGLMALAFDAADDVADPLVTNDATGKLTGYLRYATGSWLYMTDYALRHDNPGGMSAEGFEYMPALGFTLQFLWGLRTAGQDDASVWGPQVVYGDHPFWNGLAESYWRSLPPTPVDNANYGELYQPMWYGDGEHYYLPDHIRMFGPLGLLSALISDTQRLNTARWVQTNLPPGGAAEIYHRARSTEDLTGGILYFLLFDPNAPALTDPRPAGFSAYFAPGQGRLLARTGSEPTARAFDYKLSWVRIDHQHADGNLFGFWRKGEWLTKERTGYGNTVAASDYKNALTVQNEPSVGSANAIYNLHNTRGSQFNLGNTYSDPLFIAHSETPNFVYALGDATALYNSRRDLIFGSPAYTGTAHVSRSIVWLEPDFIALYDRAETTATNRFKRFWLNLPYTPTITGTLADATTPNGQHLFVTTLLPLNATPVVTASDPTLETWALADYDPMQVRLKVEAPGQPQRARFLHVLQGADANAAPAPVTLIQSISGTLFTGAVVSDTALLFPIDLGLVTSAIITTGAPFIGTTYTVTANITRHLITGLRPHGGYTVVTQTVGGAFQITLTPNGVQVFADSGGVLLVDLAGALATAPEIVSAAQATGVVGQPFTYTIAVIGSAPLTYTTSALPAGLGLTGAVINGKPTQIGTTNVTLTATNAAGSSQKQLVINITPLWTDWLYLPMVRR